MLLAIPEVLTKQEVRECRSVLEQASWIDGAATAGFQSRQVKNNQQLAEDSEEAQRIGQKILSALQKNLLFNSAALPAHIFPPLFNKYEGDQGFGNHVDNAIRHSRVTGQRIRTDLSMTLFFSDPDEYEGGELIIDDTYGPQTVKLAAGHMVLYPSTSLHRVMPVTRGARISSFFWMQSLVRDDAKRALLFDMDMSIIRLRKELGDNPDVVRLTGIYHNMLRRWAEV